MKRNRPYNAIPIALLAGLLCLSSNTEASALTYEHTLNIPLSDLTISTDTIKGELRSRISVTDRSEYVNRDTLLLPMKNLRFKVPLLAENFRIKSWNVNSSAPMAMDYPPAKYLPEPPHHHYENESSVENDPYAEFDPASISYDPVVLMGDYYLGAEEHYLNVGIHAVEYSDTQLKANTSVSFIIEYSMKDEASLENSPLKRAFQSMRSPEANGIPFELSSLKVSPSTLVGINYKNYVILVPEALKSGVSKLRNWKRQKGYKVTLKTFEGIYNDPLYAIGASNKLFDQASQVREWLRDFYNSNGGCYCLIIGDYTTSAPIRKFRMMDPDSSTTPDDPNDPTYEPTDIYFADLITEWDFSLESSGIYSAPTSEYLFSPTVSVGRLLCRSKKEIEVYTDKLILYENYPGYGKDAYLSKGFMGQHRDAIVWRCETELMNIPELQTTLIQEKRASNIQDSYPDPALVLSEVGQSGLVSLQYHGTQFTLNPCSEYNSRIGRNIYSEYKYQFAHNWFYTGDTNNIVSDLTNITTPNVIYTMACDIAPFDRMTISHMPSVTENYYTIASKLTTGGKYGAAAILCNTREGIWPASPYVETEFMKLIKGNLSIGLCQNYSKVNYTFHPNWTDKYNSVYNIVTYRHNIIGDSELTIWIGQPSHKSPEIISLNDGINLTYSPGDNTKYSLICEDYIIRNDISPLLNGKIQFETEFINALSSKLGYMMIMEPRTLPSHYLLTTGNQIVNCKENLITRDLKFRKDTGIQSKNIITASPYLWIGEGSDIRIQSMGKIESEEGIRISKNGKLDISAKNKVTLTGDKVEKGGTLNISGEEVILGPGVTIENGGEVNINCN